MELKNTQIIHSSDKCEITLGELDGKQYIKKTGNFSRNVVERISQINSPYIARIVEIGDDYIITEYIDGKDLSRVKLPAKKVYDIALELCDALDSIHKQNIIHRDIKPSNIILCNDGHIRLIDFDAARVKKPVTDKDTRFVGTDGFAPPEQYGFTQTDERSDIYALGVTIKLLLGESFNHASYRRVIEKCTRFNPEQRYRSVKAVKSALKRNKVMPFIAASFGVALVAVALILRLALITPKDNSIISNNSSSMEIASESSVISSYSSSADSTAQSGVVSNYSSSAESSAVSSSSLSTTSTYQSSSVSSGTSKSSSVSKSSAVSSSSSKTESVPVSSTVSINSSSTKIPPESIPPVSSTPVFPLENERSYTIDWDLLTLPKGFPRLRDKVSFYDFNAVDDATGLNDADRYIIYWNVMPKNEVEDIIQKVHNWLGFGSDYKYFPYDTPDKIEWLLSNNDFDIYISWGTDEPTATWLSITPKAINYNFPKPNTELANPSVTKSSQRPLKWEETILNGKIFKLTDSITSLYSGNGSYNILWDRMDISELVAVIQKVINLFDGEYEFNMVFRENVYNWNFTGNIKGVQRSVEVSYIAFYSTDYVDQPQVCVAYK